MVSPLRKEGRPGTLSAGVGGRQGEDRSFLSLPGVESQVRLHSGGDIRQSQAGDCEEETEGGTEGPSAAQAGQLRALRIWRGTR